MADTVDRATRSRIMRAIKGKDTKPELALRAALRALGHRTRHYLDVPGRPDVVVGRLAVFVHGCFWHGCAHHYRPPKSNVAFWRRKLAGNMRRDTRMRRRLRALGYATMVVWEHEDAMAAAARVSRRLSRL